MLKIYTTVLESKEDGSAVVLFEDYLLRYDDKYDVYGNPEKDLSKMIYEKIEQVEAIRDEATSPF